MWYQKLGILDPNVLLILPLEYFKVRLKLKSIKYASWDRSLIASFILVRFYRLIF